MSGSGPTRTTLEGEALRERRPKLPCGEVLQCAKASVEFGRSQAAGAKRILAV